MKFLACPYFWGGWFICWFPAYLIALLNFPYSEFWLTVGLGFALTAGFRVAYDWIG